jgi:hypothetical protein
MPLYSIDTSSLVAAWVERYPLRNFPGFWKALEGAIENGDLRASAEVLREAKKRDNDLHNWCKRQRDFIVEVDDACQGHVATIMGRWPRFVDTRTGKNSGDPFVMAMALQHEPQLTVVTEENGGNDNRPTIPHVCTALRLRPIKLLALIQAYGWQF